MTVSVESAIENIREAALFPAHWPVALGAIGEAFNSNGASLVLKTTKVGSIAVSASIQPFVSSYMSNSIPDPREKRVNPTLSEGFMPDHAYFSAKEIAGEPYYQEFLRPNGFGWNAIAALQGDLMLSVKREYRRGPYDSCDLQALNSVLPWIRSVSRSASITWSSNFNGQLDAFDRLHRGAIMLDRKARVMQINASTRFGDGLDVINGFLQARHAADQAQLRKFLACIIDCSSGVAPRSLAITRPSGARPWLVDGISCTDSLHSLHSNVAALVLITDLDSPCLPRSDQLSDLFHLSSTERKLATHLAAGQSLQQAAISLSISEQHARQRLKAIFQKTDTSRQTELIALFAKLA
jgi:DNA-binding CsgD family transcriptional regulator